MWFAKLKRRFKSKKEIEIYPDEILLDSKNLPQFDTNQFEGRLEKPISRITILSVGIVFIFILSAFSYKAYNLQISSGNDYSEKSENNRLRHSLVFSERGVIYDRNNVPLAWNEPNKNRDDVSSRAYIDKNGLSNLLGYIRYPSKDKYGFYYREDFSGVDGAEKIFDTNLKGENGIKITETDALGNITSESVLRPPKDGDSVVLSIDWRLQNALYGYIKQLADEVNFTGGAGVIMDIETGEIYALATYPEYDSAIMSSGKDTTTINGYLKDKKLPFLNRPVNGLFTPGSTMKPFVAIGALSENIISPEKNILSTGSISIQNPYDKTKKTLFTDWKAHGYVDMRHALAVSSNVYFYEIGGGFEDQKGLGIVNLEKYYKIFGFGSSALSDFFDAPSGVIPNPEWKSQNFTDGIWRIGDTYYTSIGQYGVQVTPVQVARAFSLIANGGKNVSPTILKKQDSETVALEKIPIDNSKMQVIREGMRLGATEGIGQSLNFPFVKVAVKTGTAEIGAHKEYVNSWSSGFFPYDNPKYAFTVLIEKGPRTNTIGASRIMKNMFEWMNIYTPEYLK